MRKFLLLFPLIFTSQAWADKNVGMANGFYFGVAGVSSSYEIASGSKSTSGHKIFLVDKTPKGFVGELQYIDLGYRKSTIGDTEVQLKALVYSLLVHFEARYGLYPYIKLGYTKWDTRSFSTSKQDSGSGVLYGLGISYKFADQWFMRAEYETFTAKYKQDSESKNLNVSLNSIAIFYKF